MDDDQCQKMNFCYDLVTTDHFAACLLIDQRQGEWLRVDDLCHKVGISTSTPNPDLVVTWLPDPFGEQGFVIVVFFDYETKESFAAHHNKQRLVDSRNA